MTTRNLAGAPHPRRALLASLLLSAALLAGCSASGDASWSSGTDHDGASVEAAEEHAGDSAALAYDDGEVTSGDDGAAARDIVITGSVTVVAGDPRGAAQAVVGLVESAGGYVEARHEVAARDDEPARATITARIPTERTNATIEALSGVGEVQDLQTDTLDVTGTVRDLDARITALRASTDRLRTLMEEASSTADLLAAEQELTARQSDLESLESQRARLAEQVAMSTLHVDVVAEPEAPQLAPGGFLGGLQNGWDALLSTLNAVVVVLGVVLPWLVLLAALVLAGRAVLTLLRRRSAHPPATPGGGAGSADGPHGSGGPGDDDGPSDDVDPSPSGERPLVGAGKPQG